MVERTKDCGYAKALMVSHPVAPSLFMKSEIKREKEVNMNSKIHSEIKEWDQAEGCFCGSVG